MWQPPVPVRRKSLAPVKSRWKGGDLTFTPGVRIGYTGAVIGCPVLLTGWAVWTEGLVGLTIIIGFVVIWVVVGLPAVLKDVWAKETVYVPEPFEWDTPTQPATPSLGDWLAAQPPPPPDSS
jgi:hypothetical protein